MRFSNSLLILVFVFVSCTSVEQDELELQEKLYGNQKWKLFRITGGFMNSETTGAEMEWQEFYTFKPDGSFLKSRFRDGLSSEATGMFEVVEFENDAEHYLELTYLTGEDLVGSCLEPNKELLIYRSAIEISNTWQACDGPGLDYKLVKD